MKKTKLGSSMVKGLADASVRVLAILLLKKPDEHRVRVIRQFVLILQDLDMVLTEQG